MGHSGTLDKSASGLLVVCTGWTTKLTKYFLDSDKRYLAVVKLGVVTDTLDNEGKVIESKNISHLSNNLIFDIEKKFTGEMLQIPPSYSALKIKGRRASDIVRNGEEVALSPRKIIIRQLEVTDIDLDNGIVYLDILCSKGTYIRSLARDIGEFLGTGGFLYGLRRISCGNFSVDNALTLDDIQGIAEGIDLEKKFCYNPTEALSDFGMIILNDKSVHKALNGAYFNRNELVTLKEVEDKPYLILDENKNFIAIADVDIRNWLIHYLNVFNKK